MMKRIIVSFYILCGLTILGFSQDKDNPQIINQKQKPKAKTENKSTKKEIKIEHLTVESFKKKIMNYGPGTNEWKYEGEKPCIIDFYADWCRPCRMLSPILEEMAENYNGKIIVYKVNTEQQKELAGLFNVSSIPALLFVPQDGGQPTMLRGYRDATQLEKVINDILLKTK